jgi:hypothetical protein
MQRVAATLLLLTACQGQIGGGGDTQLDPTTNPVPEDFEPAFKLPDQQLLLLPFWVRLERVASVIGRATDDPILDVLNANHLALGDYDYSSGVKPDRMWSPSRMTLWAKSLKPVCGSEPMRSLYPDLTTPSDAAALASDAWGREVSESELDLSGNALATLPEAERYEAVCLAMLSAAEFVAQ